MMNAGKKVGIYGGTFDPVHFGHLNLAIEMKEAHQLDEIWFCPAKMSPHKLDQKPTADEHRLAMLQLALEEMTFCKLLDIEMKRPSPSYTVDTIRALMTQEHLQKSPCTFSLIIGDDAIPGFFQWHQPQEIVKMVPVLVGRRRAVVPPLQGDPAICAALKKGMTDTRIMDICSTDLRQRLAAGLYCGHLIPAKVVDYISAHRLY